MNHQQRKYAVRLFLAVAVSSAGLLPTRPARSGPAPENPDAKNSKHEAQVKEEIDKLQGTWAIVSLEVEGMKMKETVFKGSKIILNGTAFTTLSMGATYKGTFTVDPTATPKTIDMNFTEGPEAGNKSLGIYELDGDTWKLCLSVGAKERPKAFATKAGSGLALESLKRERAGAAREAPKDEKPARGEQWVMVSGEREGQPLPPVLVKNARRVVNGQQVTVSFGGQLYLRATYSIDTSKTPHAIDYAITDGADKGKKQLGICEADADTFRTCFATPGKERPERFKTKPGDGLTLSLWRRAGQ
jgi:uncharacterized protein (TIGR03067 family)